MIDILEKYPVPWKAKKVGGNIHLWADNQELILITGRQDHFGLFQFIAETVNNSVRPRITDALCECPSGNCNWVGAVWDCEGDIDNEGSLGCPKCLTVIKVYA